MLDIVLLLVNAGEYFVGCSLAITECWRIYFGYCLGIRECWRIFCWLLSCKW